MDRFKNITYTLRVMLGAIIMVHGLLRILFLSKYISFVINQFYNVIPNETWLTLSASLLPFLEFFIGLLIIYNVKSKIAIWVAIVLSLLTSIFLVFKNLYPRLIYHCFLIVVFLFMYATTKKTSNAYT